MKKYILIIFSLLIYSQCWAETTLERAKPLLPILDNQINLYWPELFIRHIPAGQVEQESSWKPRATLKTERELGRGLVQITITPRFNNFLTATSMKPLKNWDWKNDPYNIKNQLTFLVLQDRSNFALNQKFMKNEEQCWKASLVSYNAGYGRIQKRRQYAIAKGIPYNVWDGGLALAHGPLEDKLLYKRPLWVAVNEYPTIIFKKAEKYKPYMRK